MKSSFIMKKINPVIKVKSIAKEQSIKLSEKAIAKRVEANNFLTDVADFFIFLARTFKETFSRDFEFKEFLRQAFQIGYKSLPLISVTGFIMGLVLTIQARPSLVHFGAVSLLPGMVAVSLIREMGPVITALICAGKIGSGMGAELGSMKVTEQIDAMEVSAINPFKYLVVTRVTATMITIPILSFYCISVGLLGSYVNVHLGEDTSFVAFFKSSFSTIQFLDLFTSVVKALAYGFTIGIVGSYKGFYATQGTRGVGKAANQAVVMAMFLIFIEEIIIVQMSNWIRYF
jgi:phospholipid/cholesterol/gamma-HCH transport system permease protein